MEVQSRVATHLRPPGWDLNLGPLGLDTLTSFLHLSQTPLHWVTWGWRGGRQPTCFLSSQPCP